MSFTFGEITKMIEILLSAIGLLFVIIGWAIPFKQSLSLNKFTQAAQLEQRKREWKMNLLNEQISKYYGPISALLKEQTIIKQRIWEQIGREFIFENGNDKLSDLAPEEQLIWTHFVDNYKLPLHRKIIEIMQNNAHLALHGDHEACVNNFLDYSLGWELLDSQKRAGVPNYYEYYYSFNYPKEFDNYIHTTLTNLINEKASLINNTNRELTDEY